jgi:hypothetical protein
MVGCDSRANRNVIVSTVGGIKTIIYAQGSHPKYQVSISGEPIVYGADQSLDTYLLADASFIGITREERVLVNDGRSTKIHVFRAEGSWIKSFGRSGQGPDEFGSSYVPYLANGELLVWNGTNRRLLQLSESGQFLAVRTPHISIGTAPIPIAQSNIGPLLTFHLSTHDRAAGPAGVRSEITLLKFRIEADSADTLYHDVRINDATLIGEGIAHQPFTILYRPYAIGPGLPLATGEVDAFVIALQELQRDCQTLIQLVRDPVPIPLEAREAEIARFARFGLEEAARRHLEFPKNYPLIRWMMWDSVGRLWVEDYSLTDLDAEGRHYEVFSTKGEWLFGINLPGRIDGAVRDGCFISGFDEIGQPVVRFHTLVGSG